MDGRGEEVRERCGKGGGKVRASEKGAWAEKDSADCILYVLHSTPDYR